MIRETQASDLQEVTKLINAAFSNQAEADLVKQLISDGDVLINLVVESAATIIGNVVVSTIILEPDINLFCGGIAPLSVLPDRQSTGIGSQLMEAAINESRALGIDALFLLGDPNYYQRFGFMRNSVFKFQHNCFNCGKSEISMSSVSKNSLNSAWNLGLFSPALRRVQVAKEVLSGIARVQLCDHVHAVAALLSEVVLCDAPWAHTR